MGHFLVWFVLWHLLARRHGLIGIVILVAIMISLSVFRTYARRGRLRRR